MKSFTWIFMLKFKNLKNYFWNCLWQSSYESPGFRVPWHLYGTSPSKAKQSEVGSIGFVRCFVVLLAVPNAHTALPSGKTSPCKSCVCGGGVRDILNKEAPIWCCTQLVLWSSLLAVQLHWVDAEG